MNTLKVILFYLDEKQCSHFFFVYVFFFNDRVIFPWTLSF